MKVTGPNGVGVAQTAKSARPAAGGFSVAQAGQSAAPARAMGVGGVSSVGALLALQAIGDPLERRRRAVGRAGVILDALDEMKLAMLDGGMSKDALAKLVGAVREQRDHTEDQALEGVLNEIETRAAVELAKLDAAA